MPRLGTGFEWPIARNLGGGAPIQQEALDWIARIATPPSAAHQTAMHRLWYRIKAAGHKDKWWVLRIGAVNDEQRSLLNIMGNYKNASYLAGQSADPVFTGANGSHKGTGHASGMGGLLTYGINLATDTLPATITQNSIGFHWWPKQGGNGNALGGAGSVRIPGTTEATTAGTIIGTYGSMRCQDTTTASTSTDQVDKVLQPFDLQSMVRVSSAYYTLYSAGQPTKKLSSVSTTFENANITELGNKGIANTVSTQENILFGITGGDWTERDEMLARDYLREFLIATGMITSTETSIGSGVDSVGFGGTNWAVQNANTGANGKTHAFKIDGGKMRFETRPGDIWSGDTLNDRQRSEIATKSKWTDFWIAWSNVIPADSGEITDYAYNVIAQLHAVDTINASPIWSLSLNNYWTAGHENDGENLREMVLWDKAANNPPAYHNAIAVALGRVARDRRMDWIQHIKVGVSDDAKLETWLNGVKIADFDGATKPITLPDGSTSPLNIGYAADAVNNYQKIGIYQTLQTLLTTINVVHNLRILNASSGDLTEYISNPLPILN